MDYVDNGNKNSKRNRARIDRYMRACRSRGFLCYAARTDRELDAINILPGIQPTPRQPHTLPFFIHPASRFRLLEPRQACMNACPDRAPGKTGPLPGIIRTP